MPVSSTSAIAHPGNTHLGVNTAFLPQHPSPSPRLGSGLGLSSTADAQNRVPSPVILFPSKTRAG